MIVDVINVKRTTEKGRSSGTKDRRRLDCDNLSKLLAQRISQGRHTSGASAHNNEGTLLCSGYLGKRDRKSVV